MFGDNSPLSTSRNPGRHPSGRASIIQPEGLKMAQNAPVTVFEKEDFKEVVLIQKVLPLVIEIVPGQAGEGLIDIYEPGTYEGIPLRELIHRTLGKRNWSVEEAQTLDDVNRQLLGGKLLIRGKEIHGPAQEYAIVEETEEGEKYLYVSVHAIKPQEGGMPVEF